MVGSTRLLRVQLKEKAQTQKEKAKRKSKAGRKNNSHRYFLTPRNCCEIQGKSLCKLIGAARIVHYVFRSSDNNVIVTVTEILGQRGGQGGEKALLAFLYTVPACLSIGQWLAGTLSQQCKQFMMVYPSI